LFVAFCVVAILSALLGDSGAEALIEVGTYFWLCVSVVIICQLVSTRIRLRQVLSALRWAGIVACVAGAIGTILIWHGNVDNVLVRGGRVTGFFEGPNQVQSLLFVVIPFLCAAAFSRTSSVATRVVHGVLIMLAFVSVVASGSRAGVLWTALAIWLTLVLASPRAGALWTCVLVLAAVLFTICAAARLRASGTAARLRAPGTTGHELAVSGTATRTPWLSAMSGSGSRCRAGSSRPRPARRTS